MLNEAFVYFGTLLAAIIGFCLGRITADKAQLPEFKIPKPKKDSQPMADDPYFDAMKGEPSRRIPAVE